MKYDDDMIRCTKYRRNNSVEMKKPVSPPPNNNLSIFNRIS